MDNNSPDTTDSASLGCRWEGTDCRTARADNLVAAARASVKANPGVSLTAVAKVAGVSRSTVVNAAADLATEARREARKSRETAKEPDPRQRAVCFLRDELAHGPKSVSAVEEAAIKARIDEQLLGQARRDLGLVTSRGNAGGVMAVQWSLPG